jgi:hypothetical protein
MTIPMELEALVESHGMHNTSRSRNLLQPRHALEFPGDSLFDQFARTVCRANVIPRKELFEAWAMALYVQEHFPTLDRIADLACSHGLLSWALLLLSKNNTRSAVCVDVRMPGSAETVADAMMAEWPRFMQEDRCWDYVEGSLEAIEPSNSTLLVGVHACGGLSDKIITLAIQGNAPLALVPCCHTKKSLLLEQRQQLPTITCSLPDFIDNHRIQRLVDAGFDVQEARIPVEFTPKNRILLATPPSSVKQIPSSSQTAATITTTTRLPTKPLNFQSKSPWRLPRFSIPVADTANAKKTVRSLAGRAASNQRKQPPPVPLCLSLFLPSDEDGLSLEQLQGLLPAETSARVEHVDTQAFLHKSGRYARTFRVLYPGTTKQSAKALHIDLCQQIPKAFPGASVRQIPT